MSAASERWPADAGLSPDLVCDVTPTAHRALPSSAHAPREARSFLTVRACRAHVPPEAMQTAALLVSELVTNALRHGAPPLSMTVGCARSWLVVEVSDASATLPVERHTDAWAEGGRGLPLVSALSSQWGAARTAAGKVTWFRLGLRS